MGRTDYVAFPRGLREAVKERPSPTMTIRLCAADVPVGATVSARDGIIEAVIHYVAALQEPGDDFFVRGVTASVGRTSRRIFTLRTSGTDPEAVSASLREALTDLAGRGKTAGSRMNCAAVTAGLRLAGRMPPGWVTGLMESGLGP